MDRPPMEVADILREYKDDYLREYGQSTTFQQLEVIEDMCRCRTAVLGGHVWQCNVCGKEDQSYNSCRNRHCNKCQGKDIKRWLKARAAELLPVHYFHIIFTIPHVFSLLALQNKRVVYNILFRASADTLLEIGRNPKYLGAELGFLGMLHTWGQKLDHHAHIHYVVSGGGVSPDGTTWVPSKSKKWFAPFEVLSLVFRGKFISQLKRAYRKSELKFHGELEKLKDVSQFEALLNESCRHLWMVYAQPPFSSPECVLKYLAPYTRRVCISNRRLISCDNGIVRFTYRDYRKNAEIRQTPLSATEFIRRYLMHIMPDNFYRIRHFGFLANKKRRKKLKLCRKLLHCQKLDLIVPTHCQTPNDEPNAEQNHDNLANDDSQLCPHCKKGHLVLKGTLKPTTLNEKETERIIKPP